MQYGFNDGHNNIGRRKRNKVKEPNAEQGYKMIQPPLRFNHNAEETTQQFRPLCS